MENTTARSRSVLAAVLILSGAAPIRAQAPAASGPSLQESVDLLQRQAVDQAHVMMDVDYHFSNLWFAEQKGNWPLAEFYLDETSSHLNWAVRVRPVRKTANGGDLPLGPILLAVQTGGVTQLREAIAKRDAKSFETAYRGMMNQCYSCHVAAEKPYLHLHIPETAGARMIDFGPAASDSKAPGKTQAPKP
jgi:hypothetical protein